MMSSFIVSDYFSNYVVSILQASWIITLFCRALTKIYTLARDGDLKIVYRNQVLHMLQCYIIMAITVTENIYNKKSKSIMFHRSST